MRWLIQLFGFFAVADWEYCTSETNIKFNSFKASQYLYPEFDSILLKTSRTLPAGWYLFCIQHTGENLRCFGTLKTENNSFPQARPMYPERRRYRIIRIRNDSVLTLKLDNLSGPLHLNLLYLRRISSFKAWRKIKKRCKKLVGRYSLARNSDSWRLYNKIQLQQRVNSSLFSYAQWRKSVEAPIQSRLDKVNNYSRNIVEFARIDSLSKATSARFVVPRLPTDKFSDYLFPILRLALKQNPDTKVFYGDNDILSSAGFREIPCFRPAWNRELFWSSNSYAHAWVIDSHIWNHAYDRLLVSEPGFTFYRLLLEILHDTETSFGINAIAHIPHVLCSITKSSFNFYACPDFLDRSKLDLQDFFYAHSDHYSEIHGISLNSAGNGFTIQWATPRQSLLSVCIPTRNSLPILDNCIKSIYSYSPGIPIELIVIDNGSTCADTLNYLDKFESFAGPNQTRQKVIKSPGAFNYSLLNNLAFNECRGNTILLLNNDTEFTEDGWGSRLASNALRPGIGCVGAKLLFPDDTIQHAGVVLGIGGVAGHSFKYYDSSLLEAGYCGRLQLAQEYSAVTAACLAISTENWIKLGGLDEINLSINYNDVDLCLRALMHGLRNIYLPDVVVYHHESKTRGKPTGSSYTHWKKEEAYMKHRWRHLLNSDPYYHPSLTLDSEDWGLWLLEHKIFSRLSCLGCKNC